MTWQDEEAEEEAAISRRFLCVDGGMLCLACLETRIGRPIKFADFTALVPGLEAWRRFIRNRPPVAL